MINYILLLVICTVLAYDHEEAIEMYRYASAVFCEN